MKHWLRWLSIVGLALTFLAAPVAQAGPAVVRAVLFFSPSCGHCHLVMAETLPPLHEKYGQQLHIIEINITQPEGQALFQAAIQRFNLAGAGVPTLIVGDVVLVGSLEIPEQLPGLIEKYLAQGGADWPAIPGLAEVISARITPVPTDESVAPAATLSASQVASASAENDAPATQPAAVNVWSNVMRDPIGNGLAVIVLFGMIVSVAAVLAPRRAPIVRSQPVWRAWAIPVLCLAGLVVAGYLAYVEAAQVEAVCGPVGDCNTVQQSEYARLFGLIPIGVLGLVGYVAIVMAWGISCCGQGRLADLAAMALFGMTLLGTLFSIYLTFLEPFVIGATCMWCLTSAVVMTALLWLTAASRRRVSVSRGVESPANQ